MQQGLAIRVPDDSSTVTRILRAGYLPLHGRPLQLALPGAAVVIVRPGGKPALIARATRLQGPTPVRLVDGQKRYGYKLWLNSIKRLGAHPPLGIRWYAVGQFRYFDPRRWATGT